MDAAIPGERNVVFLVLDSLRKDRVSVYDDSVDCTERLDALADRGIVFEDAVTQAPWTLPSHASMFTGEYPWTHGTTHARSYFEGEFDTFVGRLREAGYDTAAITPNVWITPHKGMTEEFDHVENFLGTADNPVSVRLSRLGTKLYHAMGELPRRVLGRQLDRLFRLFDVDDSCKSEETVTAVEEYLDDRGEEPFFLYANLMEPHEPYRPPMEYRERHGVDESATIPHRQKDVFTEDDIDYDALRAVYDASVEYTDDLVGRIVDALDRNGLREDTVVVVLSDHGQVLGDDHIGFGHQFTVAEPVVNTVLFVDHPDLPADTYDQSFELRRLYDLVPYYAGVDDPPESPFAETVRGGCEYPQNFTGYIPKDRWDEFYRKFRYAKRDGRKVVKSVTEDGTAEYEAYDVETGESIPVPDDLQAVVDDAADVAVEGDRETDPEVQQRLEELGYK